MLEESWVSRWDKIMDRLGALEVESDDSLEYWLLMDKWYEMVESVRNEDVVLFEKVVFSGFSDKEVVLVHEGIEYSFKELRGLEEKKLKEICRWNGYDFENEDGSVELEVISLDKMDLVLVSVFLYSERCLVR